MSNSNKEVQAQPKVKTIKVGAIRDRKDWKAAVEKLAMAASTDQFVRSLAELFDQVRKRIAFKDKSTGEIKWKPHGGCVQRLAMPLASVKGTMRVEVNPELPLSEQMAKLLGQLAQELTTEGQDQVFIIRYEGDSYDVITASVGTDEWMRKILRFSKAQSWEA
ncbi:hypothetical protein D3C87_1410860 [compost metagenome]